MIDFIKKHWKVLLAGIGIAIAFVAGLVLRGSSGRKSDLLSNGNVSNQSGLSGAVENLGKLEANQSSASQQNNGIGHAIDSSQNLTGEIAGDNKESGVNINDAQDQLDRLGKDLGLK